MRASLAGQRIAVLARHGFENVELTGTTSITPLALDVGASAIAIAAGSRRPLERQLTHGSAGGRSVNRITTGGQRCAR
jgi:hypothetical protein